MNLTYNPEQRKNEQIASKLKNFETELCKLQFLLSSSDWGVERNGGRNGAKWGPKAILNNFSKLNFPLNSKSTPPFPWGVSEVFHHQDNNFFKTQQASTELIKEKISSSPSTETYIHLGGGHDHVQCLLQALSENAQPIIIINLDAHCDTRTDSEPHSGNPFRLFTNGRKNVHLVQVGIHPFANSPSTLTPLSDGNFMHIFSRREFDSPQNILQKIEQIVPVNSAPQMVLSLDCDVLDASIMSGVSAPNHFGLSLKEVLPFFLWYKNWAKKNKRKQYVGIYEYNPKYDDLSQKGARAISALLFHFLFES